MTTQTYRSLTLTVDYYHLRSKHIQEEYHELRLHPEQSEQLSSSSSTATDSITSLCRIF